MIRPVEMQMLIPQTETVSHVQQQNNQRTLTDQSVAVNQVEKEVKEQSDTVIQKDTVEIRDYKHDAKEKGDNEYSGDGGRHRKKKNEADNKEDTKETPRVNFDIRI